MSIMESRYIFNPDLLIHSPGIVVKKTQLPGHFLKVLFTHNSLKSFLSALVFLVVIFRGSAQQVPQYSQYLFNPIYINPAYTGYKNDVFVQTFFRKQWAGLEGAPTTYGVAADGIIPLHNIGLGVVASSDQLGLQTTQSLYFNAAYHLQTGEYSYLSFGAGLGFVNYRIKSEKYDPTVAADPSLIGTGGGVIYPDLNLGLLYYSDRFYAGFSIDHALENILQINNVDLAVKPKRSYSLTAGALIDLNGYFSLKPSLLLLDDLKSMTRIDGNLFLQYDQLVGLGLGYRRSFNFFERVDDIGLQKEIAFIVLAEIFIRKNFRFGYAFDLPVSGQWSRLNSHEFSLGYMISSPRSRLKSPRYF
ncbi:PorP/SprF family type IX secretion system membrane protein [Algoriphagus sp. AGSA1]|uniref:PorP/SprF family type IX secretion system membrane protein n=1 Tax=Algoriphagus sp. AGSA1 TaxID=2907213 RepID=UPI001F323A8D|nr:PorP/SprF family type IX secretion system membrane protein [Algoriphagus sp. AGSA1]MCE7053730.1 PorP/SprF family type IX secretion system membrane protein [Algoriphagus sp. AGSA1]